MKSFLLLFIGIISGIVMTLSCDDGSPERVDAAPVCDCPVGEPPITLQRIVEVRNTGTLPPLAQGGRGGQGAACPGFDDIAISGSCQIDDGSSKDIVLEEFIANGGGWNCLWKNNTNAPVVVRATVRCLVPKT